MKILKVFLALGIYLSVCSSTYAANTPQVDAAVVKAPIGSWEVEKKHPSGAIIKVHLNLIDDHKFSGSMSVDGNIKWTYKGTWSFNGDKLVYVYTESSKPIPANFTDSDVVLSVTDNEYTYKSDATGELGTYNKIK